MTSGGYDLGSPDSGKRTAGMVTEAVFELVFFIESRATVTGSKP